MVGGRSSLFNGIDKPVSQLAVKEFDSFLSGSGAMVNRLAYTIDTHLCIATISGGRFFSAIVLVFNASSK